MKIICAGFQKTGTKSLSRALEMLGYKGKQVLKKPFWVIKAKIYTLDDFLIFATKIPCLHCKPAGHMRTVWTYLT